MNLYVPAMIEILLISVSVAMDAFAVSIGKGLTVTRVRPVDVIKTALWFGGFQALFPLLGFFAANTFSNTSPRLIIGSFSRCSRSSAAT